MSRTWDSVWASRRLDASRGSTLAQLMAADGLDTGFGSVGEESWRLFARRIAREIQVQPGERAFEVGCGAGAFLCEWRAQGIAVSGLDRSPALVDYARAAMPDGHFVVGDAIDVDPIPSCEAVISCGVFLYFPAVDYAAEVIARMAAKATRAVAILDVPDKAREEEALRHRRASLGPEEYRERYAGLEHLYYERAWMVEALERCGLRGVRAEDQAIPGYANAAFRFNVFGFRR